MNLQSDVDVVVVGAGLSGLHAATLLKDAGLTVAVLEARNRVGGLTFSPESKAYGGRVDLGGQWVAPQHKRIHKLIQKYRVPLVKQYAHGLRTCLHESQALVGPMGTVPGLSPQEEVAYKEAYKCLYDAMEKVAENPWESPDATRLDSMTYASWVDSICAPGKVHAAMARISGAYYGALPEEISALELLQKVKSCGGPVFMSDMVSGGLSAHMMGSQMVSEGMAHDLASDVTCSSPVRWIEWAQEKPIVHSDAGSWRCRYVVFATSPTMISQIRFDPALPSKRRMLHQRFPNGRNTKAAIVYQTPFWRGRGLSGNVISTDGSLTVVADLGGDAPEKGILVVLFTGRPAHGVDHLPPEERRTKILALLALALGQEALRPIEYMDQVWADEEWSGGASSPFLTPGALTTIGSGLREPVGPLYWAGTHMAVEYRGYMEGALAAGEAAALGVTKVLRA